MSVKVAINGFGRIGRAFFKLAKDDPELEVVAVNDLGDINNLAYLLKYDSAYGTFKDEIAVNKERGTIRAREKELLVLNEKDASKLPWAKLGIDIVVESTGLFTSYDKAKVHLDAGAKKVVITAPAKGESAAKGSTVLVGINEEDLKTCDISSNASCTTNAASPVIKILSEELGIEKALLNTVHAYTASQRIVDSPSGKDLREGRAAAVNIIPSSTGAAIATTKVITELENKFDGISIRVPVISGSIVDVTFISKKNTTSEEVNAILTKAAMSERWRGIFSVTTDPLVSSDIIGEPNASVADLNFTRVADGNLVKVLAWYDNEMGYTYTLLRHVKKVAALIK